MVYMQFTAYIIILES